MKNRVCRFERGPWHFMTEQIDIAYEKERLSHENFTLGVDSVESFFPKLAKNLHTRQLLGQLHRLRALETAHMQWAKQSLEVYGVVGAFTAGGLVAITALIKAAKEVLATREHVPNKPEAKALRRSRALAGRKLPKHHPLARATHGPHADAAAGPG